MQITTSLIFANFKCFKRKLKFSNRSSKRVEIGKQNEVGKGVVFIQEKDFLVYRLDSRAIYFDPIRTPLSPFIN